MHVKSNSVSAMQQLVFMLGVDSGYAEPQPKSCGGSGYQESPLDHNGTDRRLQIGQYIEYIEIN